MRFSSIWTASFLIMIFVVTAISGADIKVGAKAPDFTLPTVDGDQSVSLSDYVNKKIVIVHFWKSR